MTFHRTIRLPLLIVCAFLLSPGVAFGTDTHTPPSAKDPVIGGISYKIDCAQYNRIIANYKASTASEDQLFRLGYLAQLRDDKLKEIGCWGNMQKICIDYCAARKTATHPSDHHHD